MRPRHIRSLVPDPVKHDNMKYSLTESLKAHDKWVELLTEKMKEAEYVEFNTLYDYSNLLPELEDLKSELVEEGRRKDKIYPSGKYRRYKLTSKLKDFILSKKYDSWANYQFEDLSLIKNEKEILATITHENYIYIMTTDEERKEFNKRGFDFGELFELKNE